LAEKKGQVLVTGGAGFIGSHVVDRLVESGYGVWVLDNLSTGKLENLKNHLEGSEISLVEGDVRDAKLVNKTVRDVETVIHLAAVTSVPFSVENPDLTLEVNVCGTTNLLASCARQKVGKFVFVSSCAAYGEPQTMPITENHPTKPVSPYAESKLVGEKYCLGFHKSGLLPSVVLRLFNVYGVRQVANDYCGVITRFIHRGMRGLPLVVYGDGSQTRDFVNVRDVADAVLSAVESRNAEGEIFNVGFGEPTSITDLANAVSESVGQKLEVLYNRPRLGDIKQSYADISKAEKLLRWKPRVALKDGLRTLLAEKRCQAKSLVKTNSLSIEPWSNSSLGLQG
jgi:UDP-glucose 4-epimerase